MVLIKYKKKGKKSLKNITIGGYKPMTLANYRGGTRISVGTWKGGLPPIPARVKQHLKNMGETKYRAENIIPAPIGVPAGQAVPLNCARMLPTLTQGVDDYQRVGNRIRPVRAKTQWNLNIFNPIGPLLDLTVNLVIFTVKGATTNTAVGAIPGGDFLRVGDGTNVDPVGPPGITDINMLNFVNNYVVNQERYTLHKWHRILFKKGPNDANGAVGVANAPPTVLGAKLHRKITYNWKPPQLKYDNNAATLPTNHYPVYLIWATNNDGTALVANSIGFTCRTELLFKDL